MPRVMLAGFLLLLWLSAALAQAADRDALVRIEIEQRRPDGSAKVISTGSGAVIDRKGFMLTARHVVEEALKQGSGLRVYGRLRSKDGVERYPLDLVGYGLGEADIALLQFPTGVKDEWDFLPYDTNDLAVQDAITGWGFPIEQDLQPIAGQVTLKEVLIFRANANFIFGMSGGPVLDQQGRVRGVVKGGSIIPGTEQLAPGLTFFVPLRLATPALSVIIAQQSGTEPATSGDIDTAKDLDSSQPPSRSPQEIRILGKTGRARVQVFGESGSLFNSSPSNTDEVNKPISVSARGDERSDCDDDFERTISTALSKSEVRDTDKSGLSFVYQTEAAGGHYAVSPVQSCFLGVPVGKSGRDTNGRAEAELEGAISFIAGSKPTEIRWRDMEGASLRLDGFVDEDGSLVRSLSSLPAEGSKTLQLQSGKRYELIVRAQARVSASGASSQARVANGFVEVR
ncbi:serine protease [Mesorhizobium sp. M0898]|uniref:S1 family peptidase n=1 Tax=Mesorhizobium sp. M0898 TaxID=2957020 RepID=UPI00333644B3